MNNNFWAPDVKPDATIDMSKPVDTRVEQAMLFAYQKGLKDKEWEMNKKMYEANVIEVIE